MEGPRILKVYLRKKLFFASLSFFLFCPGLFVFGSGMFEGRPDGAGIGGIGKRQSVRNMAVELLEVGIEEYKQALFGASEKTLLKAQMYKRYLSEEERSRLSRYLKSASEAAVRRKSALDHIKSADRLVREGKIIRAKAHLKEINGSELLTEREKRFVKEGLEKINKWLAEQQAQIKKLYERSAAFYNAGQLENSRAGFIKVARSGLVVMPDGQCPEDYIHKIDLLIGKSVEPFGLTDADLFERQSKVRDAFSGKDGLLDSEAARDRKGLTVLGRPQELYIEGVSHKRKLVMGYTSAVVNDSVTKARGYLDVGKFYNAQKELEKAKKVLAEKRLYLDDDIFAEYSSQIEKLEQEITEGRAKWLGGFSNKSSLE